MDIQRIRHLAELALSGFETLDLDTAAELARADLRDILKELDATDDPVAISCVVSVETG